METPLAKAGEVANEPGQRQIGIIMLGICHGLTEPIDLPTSLAALPAQGGG